MEKARRVPSWRRPSSLHLKMVLGNSFSGESEKLPTFIVSRFQHLNSSIDELHHLCFKAASIAFLVNFEENDFMTIRTNKSGFLPRFLCGFLFFLMATSEASAVVSTDLEVSVRRYVEEKYQEKMVSLCIVPIAPGIIAARFDWQADWWGGMAILGVDERNRVKFSYDIPESPDAPTIIELRSVRLRQCERPVVLAIGRTHMGNGMLYLYELFPGRARLILSTRAVGNFPEARFTKRVADLIFSDVDKDGCDDLLVTVPVELDGPQGKRRTRYQRFFRGTTWGFREDTGKAHATECFNDE